MMLPSPCISAWIKLFEAEKLTLGCSHHKWQIQFTTAEEILGFTRAARQDLSESRDWSENQL